MRLQTHNSQFKYGYIIGNLSCNFSFFFKTGSVIYSHIFLISALLIKRFQLKCNLLDIQSNGVKSWSEITVMDQDINRPEIKLMNAMPGLTNQNQNGIFPKFTYIKFQINSNQAWRKGKQREHLPPTRSFQGNCSKKWSPSKPIKNAKLINL